MTTRRIATDAQNPLGKSVICIPIALVTLGVLVGGYATGECEPEEAVDVRPVADEAGGVDGTPEDERAAAESEDSAGDGGAAAVYEEWPFDAEEAKRRQRETAEALGIPVEKTLDLGDGVTMKLVLIPAGEFVMGSPADEERRDDDEGPQRRVMLTKPFYVGAYEVTKVQFAQFVSDSGYKTTAEKQGWSYAYKGDGWGKVDGASWRKPGFAQGDDHPVVCVSHDDASAFCRWLSRKHGARVRLPSEAQWEYAARAGSKTVYPWGDDPDEGKGWANAGDRTAKEKYSGWIVFNWSDGYVFTAPVGGFRSNGFGLHDTVGNVWEWCADWYQDSYEGLATEDPKGPRSGKARVLRGGSWYDSPRNCRSAYRIWGVPDYRISRHGGIGFRVVVLGGDPRGKEATGDGEDEREEAGDGGAAAVYEEWPFDAEEAKRRQRETAEALGIPVEKTLDLGDGVTMKLVLIPAGEFVMGSPADEERRDDDEGPQRRVMLTKPFYVGAYEVTKVQFAQFVSDSGYKTTAEKQGWSYAYKGDGWGKVDGASWRKPGFAQGDDHPVVCVSHDDASAFCRWLSRKHGARVRLPSEAQWEYAARAGSKTVYPWGDDPDEGKGWANAGDRTAKEKYSGWIVFNWSDGYVFTAPVGGFRSNGFGLHDTVGNVWEWCADWYQDSYEGLATEDPKGPKGGKHGVQRGGSWCSFPWDCRSALRYGGTPGHRSGNIGFRVVVLAGDPRGKEATGDGEDEREEAGDGGAAAVYEEWPFDAEEAKRRQRETAEALGIPVEKTLDLGDGVTMKLVLIPAGEFVMGSGESAAEVARKGCGEAEWYEDEHPQRRVTLTEPFYMGVCEVTQEQYEQLLGKAPWRGKTYAKTGAEHAANYISWDDATSFCEKLSARTGLDVRLPSEAQWEYACRAGSTTRYCYGDDAGKLGAYAWYYDNALDVGDKYAHTVGRKRPNAFGLHDMHGNVWEWCADWFQDSYRGLATEDPKGPRSGKVRVLRGGSWYYFPRHCRSASRLRFVPDFTFFNLGFRVVVDLE